MSRTNYTKLMVGDLLPDNADISSIVTRFQPITGLERDAIPSPVNGMLIYNSDTNLIEGYIAGLWPIEESTVIAHEDAWIQTRTQGSFNHTGGATDGTILTPLDITITPAKVGDKAIIEFVIFGESTGSGKSGFVITRNSVLMTDTTDGTNNDYAVNAVTSFDNNATSTPQVIVVRLIDNNTLDIETTYRILYRVTNNGEAETFKLNRSINSPGDSTETGVSTAKIIEYVT